MELRINLQDVIDFMYSGLTDFGYVPTNEEVQFIACLCIDYVIELLDLDLEFEGEEF